jgi:division protein CdvB (Snf7/Vps24/ESCRT-III family)
MSGISKLWRKNDQVIHRRFRERVAQIDPLKPKIEEAEKMIKSQMQRIDMSHSRISERDSYIFRKVIMALQKKDNQRASIYANELSEVRRIEKLVTQSRLAFQQILLRLHTIRDLDDAVSLISPAISVVKNVGTNLSFLLPDTQGEITEINSILGDILVEAGELTGGNKPIIETKNEDSENILAEASALAEKRMRQLFPEVSTSKLQDEIEVI